MKETSSPPSSTRSWLQPGVDGSILLRVRVQPRSSRDEVGEVLLEGGPGGISEERLKVKLSAPPVDGEANEALLRFLRKLLRLPSGSLELIRGQTSREKDIRVRGTSESVIRSILLKE